ncbi:MAG: hypothetical protein IJ497_04875 [Clostridia bacterium]|nr:hypothetical protein [Clostridia bacterium]
MKTVSNVKPAGYVVENLNDGWCNILFAINIVAREVTDEGEKKPHQEFSYDLYTLHTAYSDSLEIRVGRNYEAWLALAMEDEHNTAVSKKVAEVREACEKAIVAGVDVTTAYGNEHFSLETHDQQNLSTIKMMVAMGATAYPYHADGKACVLYSAEDLNNIVETATYHVAWHTTYCNMLRVWIGRETDTDVINGIYYGIALPEDLAAKMNELV